MIRKKTKCLSLFLILLIVFNMNAPIAKAMSIEEHINHEHTHEHDDHYHELSDYAAEDSDTVLQTLDKKGISLKLITELKDQGYTGKNVKVAMIDSGVEVSESNIELQGGVSFIENQGYDTDHMNHGTLAAMIFQKDIAPNIDLYSVRVLDERGIGTVDDVIRAIEWSIEHDMHIISIGFVLNEYSQELHNAIIRAYKNKIIIVAPAGNYSSSTATYPAAFHEVIAVGARDSNGICDYSNY